MLLLSFQGHPVMSGQANILQYIYIGFMLGSRVPGGVLLWSCVFLPAGGVEDPIFATAADAGRRTCQQSTSATYLRTECLSTSVGEFWCFPW